MFGNAYGGQNEQLPEEPQDIEIVLDCSLKEFYNGSQKKISYSRAVIKNDAKTTHDVQEKFELTVQPGFNEETKLVFKAKGHEARGHQASNLVVKFKLIDQAESKCYKRVGSDLVYTHSITLE